MNYNDQNTKTVRLVTLYHRVTKVNVKGLMILQTRKKYINPTGKFEGKVTYQESIQNR